MRYTTFISPADLSSHLLDPDWVIIDCRYDLQEKSLGFLNYREAHIPKAVYCDLEEDLSGPVDKTSGRHPLPSLDRLKKILGNMGIDFTKQVVAYDGTSGSFAGRLWWILQYMGHESVAVLDGGFNRWISEERPTEMGVRYNGEKNFQGKPHPELLVELEEMEKLVGNPEYLFVDARAPERYRGEVEPLDPVAGRIPGALNFFHGKNMDSQGKILPTEELREKYLSLLKNHDPSKVVLYCGSGVTSCLDLIVMKHLGLCGARLYAGSWSQWCSDPARAVEKG